MRRWPLDPTPAEIQEMLRVPSDFGMHSGHPKQENPDTWAIGPGILNRDSGLLEESNADALKKALAEEPALAEEWSIQTHGHWACGWVEQICFRLLDEEGKITPIYSWLAEWFHALDDDPIADEEDHGRREKEATIENIQFEGRKLVAENAPGDWAEQVWVWLGANNESQVEGLDDRGGCPSEDAIGAALAALGMKQDEEEE